MIEAFANAEKMILLFIQEVIRNPALTSFFVVVTKLGDGGMIWILTTVILLLSKKTRKIGCIMTFSLLGSLVINNLFLKNVVGRARPYEMIQDLLPLIKKPKDYAFPSGHTASSFAAAGVLYRKLPKRFGIPALILAVLIALSRLYLGVHYPSDVLCGMISGIGISFAAEIAVNQVSERLGGEYFMRILLFFGYE